MNTLKKRVFIGLTGIALILLVTQNAIGGPIGFSVSSKGNDHLYQIDLMTGIAIDLGKINFGDAEGLAFVGTKLYAIGGSFGFSLMSRFWDITEPPGSLIGSTGTSRRSVDHGLDYDVTTGTLYDYQGFTDFSGGALYRIDPATGIATSIGNSNSQFADGLAINKAGEAFVIDGIVNDSLYQLDLTTGDVSLIGSLGFASNSNFGLSFDQMGTLWGLNATGEIYRIDTSTGQASSPVRVTLNGATTQLTGFEGLAIQQIPEPGSLALLGIGLAGLGFMRRRRA